MKFAVFMLNISMTSPRASCTFLFKRHIFNNGFFFPSSQQPTPGCAFYLISMYFFLIYICAFLCG